VHVASPPETHDVCPGEQLLVHVSEQAAEGEAPAQLLGEAQVAVDATYKQPFVSVLQVATVAESWQAVPWAVQMVELQVHDAPASPTVHAW
jgi:hypothetical protein